MKIKLPGKAILLIGLILACAFALSAADRQVNLSSSGNHARLLNNSDLGFDVQFRVGDLKIMEVQTKKGTFDELSIDGWGFSNDVGEPKLPMLRRTIAVPLGAEVRFYLNSQSTRELDSKASKLQNRVIPAQEPISRAADPATLPFEVNERLYSLDEFNNRDWVQVTELGIIRGVRVFALDFYPVRYNPVTNSIQVMENVDVRVDFVNSGLSTRHRRRSRLSANIPNHYLFLSPPGRLAGGSDHQLYQYRLRPRRHHRAALRIPKPGRSDGESGRLHR